MITVCVANTRIITEADRSRKPLASGFRTCLRAQAMLNVRPIISPDTECLALLPKFRLNSSTEPCGSSPQARDAMRFIAWAASISFFGAGRKKIQRRNR